MNDGLVGITGHNGYLGAWVAYQLARHSDCNIHNSMSLYKQSETIVHLHWYSSPGNGEPELQQRCLQETIDLVQRIRGSDTRLIFASTASVYGDCGVDVKSEEDAVNPNCHYTEAKVKAEECIRENLPDRHLILRLGSLMGKGITRTRTDLIVNNFAAEGWTNRKIQCWSPYSWKPVIHVRDAAEIIGISVTEGWVGTINVALESLQARFIAQQTAEMTGAIVQYLDSPTEWKRTGTRSCRLNTFRLQHLLKSRGLRRTLYDTITEFKDYVPSAEDRNSPSRWQEKPG